jgi:hypothetical protein
MLPAAGICRFSTKLRSSSLQCLYLRLGELVEFIRHRETKRSITQMKNAPWFIIYSCSSATSLIFPTCRPPKQRPWTKPVEISCRSRNPITLFAIPASTARAETDRFFS